MNILLKLQEQDTAEWNKLTDEQRESAKDAAIIELAYDIKMSIKSARNVHRLIMRLDDYEALIAKLNEALQHMIKERDGAK